MRVSEIASKRELAMILSERSGVPLRDLLRAENPLEMLKLANATVDEMRRWIKEWERRPENARMMVVVTDERRQ